jgi:hypothetical protein
MGEFYNKIGKIYGGEKKVELTKKQKEARARLIKQHGKPLNEFDNKMMGVYFLEYNFGVIGIEKDGYAHM